MTALKISIQEEEEEGNKNGENKHEDGVCGGGGDNGWCNC